MKEKQEAEKISAGQPVLNKNTFSWLWEFTKGKRGSVSFEIPEKTTAAFVGPSGGGKTTITLLLARFWDVDSGQVLLGGTDITEYSYDSLIV